MYEDFSMAVLDDKVTTIGGRHSYIRKDTSDLLSFLPESKLYKKIFPSMPTKRRLPAVVTTPSHLVVAGGDQFGFDEHLHRYKWVEVLDLSNQQWFVASSSPYPVRNPQMTLCNNCLYLSNNETVITCSVEGLLKSCRKVDGKEQTPDSCSKTEGDCVWTRLADHPIQLLMTLREQVIAIGDRDGENPTVAIHCYDGTTDSWNITGHLPAPLSSALASVLPSNEVIVVGGITDKESFDTYIGSCD